MCKKAVLVVSFGTSYRDTLEKTISAIERDISARLPDRTLRRAFTSGIILRKLAARDGLDIDDVPRALARLVGEGVTDVLIQPTHIMNGDEYDKLCAQAAPYRAQFAPMAIGAPLLTAPDDYPAVAEALLAELPERTADAAIVFMGHGTGHFANAAYCQLEYLLHDMGRTDLLFGTVEGYPGLPEVKRRLAERPEVKRIMLYPFMVVAGDHACNDLAGEEPDAWRSQLSALGYEVACTLRGLGEYPGIRSLFTRHATAREGGEI